MRLPAILIALTLPLAAQEGSPSPVQEQSVFGSIDVGYRWVSDVQGDRNTYRSVVNVDEGVRVVGLDFTFEDPKGRLFDKLTAFADNWGDPYNVGRLDVERKGAYRLLFDYRNIDYFNFLPSFANPGLASGSLVNERSFDIRRRLWSGELELLPGGRIQPYVAFGRDSGSGTGITPFVVDGNEYPVATDIREQTNNYRGGVRFEFRRWHLTLEQGGTTFKDDQRVFTDERNTGNRSTTLLRRQLFIDSVNQAYGIRGDSIYSRVLFTATPVSWANLNGQFLYSQPSSDVNYASAGEGLFYLGGTSFADTLSATGTGSAKQPHTSGSFSAEIQPHQRVRIIESLMTDRFHNASSFEVAQPFLLSSVMDRLTMTYNRQQAEVLVDITNRLTLRGGHRYEWGDSTIRAASLNQSGRPETGNLVRHVGLFGMSYRVGGGTAVHMDYEGAATDESYFRTSLHDYHQFRVRSRTRLTQALDLGINIRLLDNENPGGGYDFRNLSAGASVQWRPGGGNRVAVLGDYTWSSYRSDISFLLPPFFRTAESAYRDRAHTATAMLDITLPGRGTVVPKISAGGSLFISSGSRPTSYYQPIGRVLLPLGEHVAGYAEWRWYGLSQVFYTFEGFRTHHFLTGLRLTY